MPSVVICCVMRKSEEALADADDRRNSLVDLSATMAPTFPRVHGINLDSQTRCQHYYGATDIVAIKMKCCGLYYACKDCHESLADHSTALWPEGAWNEPAVLCGACGAILTILQYMQSDSRSPACRAQFNPGCRNHNHFYFQVPQTTEAPSESTGRGHL